MRPILVLALSLLTLACSPIDNKPFGRIETAINTAKEPGSFEDWHRVTSELENTMDKEWAQAISDPTICDQLRQLPIESLLALHSKLLEFYADLTCTPELIKKIVDHRALRMNQIFWTTTLPKLSNCTPSKSNPAAQVSIKEIDTTGGPRFVTGDLPRCHIALTFDDGPHPIYTQEILDSLKKFDTKAVFFQMGHKVAKYLNLTKIVSDQGHTLANHTWSHQNMPKISVNAGVTEINRGFSALLASEKIVSPFFRFPYGAFTKPLRQHLVSTNVSEFFWNMDTLDWKLKDPKKLYENVIAEIEREKRGIILFHDVHPQTSEILPLLLNELFVAGYKTVLLKPKYYIDVEQ